MRRVQPLAAQQLADLARPGARVSLGEDLRLVLRRERPALGLLDQLRVRRPPPARRARRPRIPARLRLAGLRGRRQPHPLPQLHSCSSPTCPAFSVLALKVIDSSMVSVSPDVDREGPTKGLRIGARSSPWGRAPTPSWSTNGGVWLSCTHVACGSRASDDHSSSRQLGCHALIAGIKKVFAASGSYQHEHHDRDRLQAEITPIQTQLRHLLEDASPKSRRNRWHRQFARD